MKIRVIHGDHARQGLTLLELVVVMLILAVLGTVMVTQTTSLASEARYEQTARTLEQLNTAVLGDPALRGPDGQQLITGFVADVGRLPVTLDELWLIGALNAFAVGKSPAGDPTVFLGAGWRGPYLRLPVGADDLTDGWGRPFDTLDEDGNASTAVGVKIVRSQGADVAAGGVGFDGDLAQAFEATVTGATNVDGVLGAVTPQFEGDLPITRVEDDMGNDPTFAIGDGQFIVVRVYGPDPTTGDVHTIEQLVHDLDVDGPTVQNLTLTQIPIGPRVVRAYQVDSAPATIDTVLSVVLDPSSDPIHYVQLPGASPTLTLVLN